MQSVAADALIPLITTVRVSGQLSDALAHIQRQHELLATGSCCLLVAECFS